MKYVEHLIELAGERYVLRRTILQEVAGSRPYPTLSLFYQGITSQILAAAQTLERRNGKAALLARNPVEGAGRTFVEDALKGFEEIVPEDETKRHFVRIDTAKRPIIRYVSDCIALRFFLQNRINHPPRKSPDWQSELKAFFHEAKPRIGQILWNLSRDSSAGFGEYEAVVTQRGTFYKMCLGHVEALQLRETPGERRAPAVTPAAHAPDNPAKSLQRVTPDKARKPAEKKHPLLGDSLYKEGIAFNPRACANDYVPHLRKALLSLERQALRERSWRGRELLTAVFSLNAMNFEQTIAQMRLLGAHLPAVDAIDTPLMDFTGYRARAFLALARVVSCQEINPRDLEWSVVLYKAALKLVPITAWRPIDVIQCCLQLIRAGEAELAIDVMARAGLRTQAPVEQALLLNNALMRLEPSTDPQARLSPLNALYSDAAIEPLVLKPEGRTPFERLSTSPVDTFVTEGPLVSVLMTTYNCDESFESAVRAVLAQSWRNLELLIVDDCSAEESFKRVLQIGESDPRIRVMQMPQNGGTYVAKNAALEVARGDYITCHDSDDWSHPRKLELQMAIIRDSGTIASTVDWCRMTEDLEVVLFSGNGSLSYECPSALMYPREPVLERVGFYDSVRTGADSEFKSRLELAFGEEVVAIRQVPLALGLTHEKALTAGTIGRGWFSPERQAYRNAWKHWHGRIRGGEAQTYLPRQQPKRLFEIPLTLRPDRARIPAPHHDDYDYDVILISDFRMAGGNTMSAIEEVKAQARAGLRTGICQLGAFRKGFFHKEFIDGRMQDVVSKGLANFVDITEAAKARLITVRYPSIFQFSQKMKAGLQGDGIVVILNQPPSERNGQDRRYDFPMCWQNIAKVFDAPQTWAPIGPLVRDSMNGIAEPGQLTERDWFNIIDLDEWSGARQHRGTVVPVIGRHSRDDYSKWPDNSQDLFSAYPDDGSVTVNILGGINSIKGMVPQTPANWVVHEFNMITPKAFLTDLDFFVFFHHPERIEAFGRTVIEAMASGIPAILPHHFDRLFGQAAIYCTPQEVSGVVSKLWRDPAAYAMLSRRSVDYVAQNFSYAAHIERLQQYGVVMANT